MTLHGPSSWKWSRRSEQNPEGPGDQMLMGCPLTKSRLGPDPWGRAELQVGLCGLSTGSEFREGRQADGQASPTPGVLVVPRPVFFFSFFSFPHNFILFCKLFLSPEVPKPKLLRLLNLQDAVPKASSLRGPS